MPLSPPLCARSISYNAKHRAERFGLGVLAGVVACFGGLAAHAQETASQLSPSQELSGTVPVIQPWGYPLDAFDKEIRPQDNFYRFANGGWLKANDIPADKSSIGFSDIMRERNEARMTTIIEELTAKRQKRGSNRQKIRDLYLSMMDEARIEKMGIKPFDADIARIVSAQSHKDVAVLMADPELGLDGPFGVFVGIDSKNPDAYTVWAAHSGLSMPDRSYYLREDERLEKTRAAYLEYITTLLTTLPGANGQVDDILRDIQQQAGLKGVTLTAEVKPQSARAEAVFALEKAIAEAHWTRAERRNASRTYNPMDLTSLSEFAPGFPFADYTASLDLSPQTKIVVREKEAFPALAKLFSDTPVSVWRDYLLVQYVNENALYMPSKFDALRFEFFGKILAGQQEQRLRSLRALGVVNNQLNQAIGKIYIDRYFPEEAKYQVTQMFENIRTAYAERIKNLTWMTAQTKEAALAKLAAVNAKIAYPEVWRDYSGVTIKKKDLFGNIKRLRRDDFNRSKARLGQAVDKREWFRGPQTVNAFYSPTRNESFVPAGYIQSPLFDPLADPAINYGALGSIIGHEIGHGFDDQGSKYDARGVLQSWWTDEDRAAFDALGDQLAAQFDEYEPLPGIHVNGRQTLGENIGDLAGMTVAYHAYLLSLNGQEPPVLDGFTGQQRFFLGRAQGRRFKRTEQSLRRRLLSAPHSPMNLRVNGMIRNMDEFYDAFDVSPGDGLYLPPEERVRIW